eukprot:5210005-Prymnesium_polylepis.1
MLSPWSPRMRLRVMRCSSMATVCGLYTSNVETASNVAFAVVYDAVTLTPVRPSVCDALTTTMHPIIRNCAGKVARFLLVAVITANLGYRQWIAVCNTRERRHVGERPAGSIRKDAGGGGSQHHKLSRGLDKVSTIEDHAILISDKSCSTDELGSAGEQAEHQAVIRSGGDRRASSHGDAQQE